MGSWQTTSSDPSTKFRATLVKRALKRSGIIYGDHAWIIEGNEKLNDSYSEYTVVLPLGERRYKCTCQTHAGGEYRKICSHILYVILAKAGKTEFAGVRTEHAETDLPRSVQTPEIPFPEPVPSDPGDQPEGPRAVIDEHFGEGLPDWLEKLRSHQWEAVEQIERLFLEGKKAVFLDAPTGCLSGDTIIIANRGGASRHYQLRDLVDKFNGGKGFSKNRRAWELDIPTQIQRAVTAPKYGFAVKLVPLVRAVMSGIQSTYTLKTDSGLSIRATADHRFALDGGVMIPLRELVPGDSILIDAGKGQGENLQKKPWYFVTQGLVNHPHRGEWPYRQPTHRLVVEAVMNDLPLDWFIAILRDKDTDNSGLSFLEPSDAVHHSDHNPHNNEFSNLHVIRHADHSRLHGLEGAWAHVANRVIADRIISIELYGKEMTYDLTVADDPHNFIANKFVVENSGKSLIGELIRRRVSLKRAIYACTTKTLQEQFVRDYPYADVIKGRSNYRTLNWPNQFPRISADLCDLTGGACTMCSEVKNCHYQTAKNIARRSPLAVANMAYLLSVWNYQEDFTGKNGGAPLVILDEADTLEAELMRFVEITFTPRALEQLGIGPPEKKTVHTSWLEWIRYTARPAVLQAIQRLNRQYRFFNEMPPREKKEFNRWVSALSKLEKIGGWSYTEQAWEEDFEMDNWVYTGYDRDTVTFKPVRVSDMGHDYIWKWANQFLLMSATIISADQMAEDLGLEDDEWGLVTVGSTFDPKRRPIYVDPTANMTFAEKDTAWPIMAQRIHRIILSHTDDRILIHTVSYAFAQYLKNHLHFKGNPRIITYSNSREREPALTRFKRSTNGVVLAASFDRGVDLPQEECRVVIIPKIPYPNLKDKQVSRRLHGRGGQSWYAMQTVRTLVQMTGRAMRSEDDSCEIYLLDKQFVRKVYRKSKGMLPGWWKEALVMSGSPRERR